METPVTPKEYEDAQQMKELNRQCKMAWNRGYKYGMAKAGAIGFFVYIWMVVIVLVLIA